MSSSPNDFFSLNLTSRPMTRRRLLGSAAGLAAAAAASALLPPNVRRVLAEAPPRGGSLRDIKHVVMLIQENRSFDHYFGTMAGVRGFDDPNALTFPTGKSVFYQPDSENPSGYLLPFHLDTQTTSAQKIPSTSHAWAVQHAAWNHGKMDQWMPAHRRIDGNNAPYVMGYHTRADIPFQFALAEAFTICDAYHCSVMASTWPNRMYWMTGTIDPDGENGGPITDTGSHVSPSGLTWTAPTRSGWRRRESVGKSITRRATRVASTCWTISRCSGKRTRTARSTRKAFTAARRVNLNRMR